MPKDKPMANVKHNSMTAAPAARAIRVRAGRVLSPTKQPSDTAFRLARRLSERIAERSARVRFGFVCRRQGDGPPPLARVLRGGRGGEVRLKLLLTLLWVAGGGDERHATRAWP